jgi:hypothetical protein
LRFKNVELAFLMEIIKDSTLKNVLAQLSRPQIDRPAETITVVLDDYDFVFQESIQLLTSKDHYVFNLARIKSLPPAPKRRIKEKPLQAGQHPPDAGGLRYLRRLTQTAAGAEEVTAKEKP